MNACQEGVRSDRLVDAGAACEAPHDPPGGVPVDGFAVLAEEDRPLDPFADRRRQLLDGLAEAVELLAAAGCTRVWLNGSFVTGKDEPADFDACWDPDGVDLDALDPIFFDLAAGRAHQKARFGGELFPTGKVR